MNIAEKAFVELFPEKDTSMYAFNVVYSGKFSGYNANVKYRKYGIIGTNRIDFHMSRNWKQVSEDIQIGLIQHLLLKVFKARKKTLNIDLYHLFLKNVHTAVPKTEAEPVLLESFNRVNEKYFFGMIEQPNLAWGSESFAKLGSYSYGEDKITMSRIFENITDEDRMYLDYVMYHEMLHKKHKFRQSGMKSYHHTKEFKAGEKKFDESIDMEKELAKFIRRKRGVMMLARRKNTNKGFLARLFEL